MNFQKISELFSVPLFLRGENHYSLTAVKNIRVTDSFMTLDQSVRKCQTEEKIYKCRTRKYLELLFERDPDIRMINYHVHLCL